MRKKERKKEEESRVCEDSRAPITGVGAKPPGRVAESQIRHVG
jgi:hypothetical protein